MPNRDPLRDVDVVVVRLTTAALTIAAGIGFIAREWHELIGHGQLVDGAVGATAALLIALAARWISR
jgi:hypothetical protein